jgi:hypothetical protein
MNATHVTQAGTAIYEPSAAEFDSLLDELAKARLGMSMAEFQRAYERGELNEASPSVSYLLALLGARTNGD